MSSETSTKPGHVFVLLSMGAATVAVMLTRQTHPVALLLLSAGVLAVGLAAYFLHGAVSAFVARPGRPAPISRERREVLLGDKQRVLHSIKELEFDQRMGKINAKDFEMLAAPLRRRALGLIEELDRLDRAGHPEAAAPAAAVCGACRTANDPDARFCKSCGAKL